MKSMKLKLVLAVALATFTINFSGCKSEKIIVIDDGIKTNKVQNVESGFADETYIWESWLFSTNKVDRRP